MNEPKLFDRRRAVLYEIGVARAGNPMECRTRLPAFFNDCAGALKTACAARGTLVMATIPGEPMPSPAARRKFMQYLAATPAIASSVAATRA